MYELKKMERYLRVNLLGPGPRLMQKRNLLGHGLTKVEKHCSRQFMWRTQSSPSWPSENKPAQYKHSASASSSFSFPHPPSSYSSDLEEKSKTLDGEIGGFPSSCLHHRFHRPMIIFPHKTGPRFNFSFWCLLCFSQRNLQKVSFLPMLVDCTRFYFSNFNSYGEAVTISAEPGLQYPASLVPCFATEDSDLILAACTLYLLKLSVSPKWMVLVHERRQWEDQRGNCGFVGIICLFVWKSLNPLGWVAGWMLQHTVGCWIKIDQLDVTSFIISLFNTQHVSNVNTSILRSLRLICWVISWVVLLLFEVCSCYGMVRLGWCGILMQAEAPPQPNHTVTPTHIETEQ